MKSPVILFSHGFAGTRMQSRFLCTHLASRGYVVAAPDHTGNTFLDLNLFRISNSAYDRPLDLRFVLDRLLAEADDPQSTLYRRLDACRCAAMGHSFGGYTALAAAGAWLDVRAKKEQGRTDSSNPDFIDFRDPRIVAAVALAPVMQPFLAPESMRGVHVPVLIIGGSRDAQTSPRLHQIPLFKSLHGVRYLGIIDGATHFNFVDQGFIDGSPLIVRMMHRPLIDRKEADALILRQTTAFLEHFVHGSPRFDFWLSARQGKLDWRLGVSPPVGAPWQ
jgi:predicted dienelactone hydrolase